MENQWGMDPEVSIEHLTDKKKSGSVFPDILMLEKGKIADIGILSSGGMV